MKKYRNFEGNNDDESMAITREKCTLIEKLLQYGSHKSKDYMRDFVRYNFLENQITQKEYDDYVKNKTVPKSITDFLAEHPNDEDDEDEEFDNNIYNK